LFSAAIKDGGIDKKGSEDHMHTRKPSLMGWRAPQRGALQPPCIQEKPWMQTLKKCIIGVTQGYTMNLEFKGIGYQAKLEEIRECSSKKLATKKICGKLEGFCRLAQNRMASSGIGSCKACLVINLG